MSVPSAEEQLRFLTNIQRLLSEGQFVATYKYALLLALADLAVETGDESGSPLTLPTARIAEKFIEYYWRQAVPFTAGSQNAAVLLRQNTGAQAAILNRLARLRNTTAGRLSDIRADNRCWSGLVRDVRQVVVQMPLWKLQTIGRESFEFLYGKSPAQGSIELKPGVAYCLRQLHSLIADLVRSAWTRYVRRLNPDILDEAVGLDEFLFGSVRANLSVAQPVLQDIQHGRCFYCDKEMSTGQSHVDHFIPWSLYPLDLGHNYVLAHQACNGSKADRLAAEDHLAAWADRNRTIGDDLTAALIPRNILCDLGATKQIASWAYSRAEQAGGQVWIGGENLVRLSAGWRSLL